MLASEVRMGANKFGCSADEHSAQTDVASPFRISLCRCILEGYKRRATSGHQFFSITEKRVDFKKIYEIEGNMVVNYIMCESGVDASSILQRLGYRVLRHVEDADTKNGDKAFYPYVFTPHHAHYEINQPLTQEDINALKEANISVYIET
ncbi:MAG: hypothetical protein HZB67_03625 [Candidatus Aenigmarchaeota archaeon]|nr:hypothetical protein [Candidatus Aenigmarchaeota archaeon]